MNTARERGATLLIALAMLALTGLLGATATLLLQLDEQAARNHRARAHAFAAARAGLDDALADLQLRTATAMTAPALAALFPATIGCGNAETLRGYCRGTAQASAWSDAQLATGTTAASYGQFTGARFPGGTNGAAVPRYVIELVNATAATDGGIGALVRLSAVGFGPQGAQVRQQSLVRLHGTGDTALRITPLAWRELYSPD